MAASLAPATSSTPATPRGSNLETEAMTPCTVSASLAKSGSVPTSKVKEIPVDTPVDKPAKRERRRDRKTKPKPKPKKKETAHCVGYYIDALDKKMLWGEARIIQCNLITQKIKVHFVGWSKNYDLWTDPMSITAHGRYAPRTKNDESVKSWDGDMHLFEDMLGAIEETSFTPVPVPAEAKPSSLLASAMKKASEKKKASSKKKTSSAKPTVARPPEKAARQPDRVAAKRKTSEHTEEKISSKNAIVISKSAERNGHKPEQPRSSKRADLGAKESNVDTVRSSKRQKREAARPVIATATPTAKAHTSKKKRGHSPDELPLYRDLELDDGTVLDFSAQREEARAEREAMQSFLEKCALIWKKQLSAVSVQ
ncbi:hypothetical protein KRP22_010605 [Phytophthora ramorum]|uniref:Tudor-knot domain-containing protein n=1 Tax=Phytophthora ramorum TaxID=164328 RepID=H3H2Z5_PHYRM|nr:hypothetical protein KRP22_5524 [Phytophthora ramorum]